MSGLGGDPTSSDGSVAPDRWRNRLSFGLGTIGRDMSAALVSLYLVYYLTEVVNISQATLVGVTVIIVVMRIFDALNDPVMGVVVDNTRSRWGKFKPWIAVGAVLWAVSTLILFVDTGLRGTGFLLVFAVAYLMWGISYTINDISFYGMLPSLSRNLKEREAIGVVARIAANVGLFSVVVGVIPITNQLTALLGSEEKAWFVFAVILVSLMLAFQSLTLIFTRQRVATPTARTPLRELFAVITRNDQLLVVTAAMLLFMAGYTATTSLGIYYFKYVYGDEGMYPIFALILGVAQLTGLAIFPLVSARLTRRQIHGVASAMCAAGLAVFALAGSSMALIAVAGVLLFMGQAFIQLLMLLFIADCVEYGEWKLGRRNESITFALQPFIYKASNALGTGLVGIALVVSGISRAQSAADLTASGVVSFKVVMMVVPMVLVIISWVVLRRWYTLDEKRYAGIVSDLRTREGLS
ncbi:glycoside-pentoside-hexuronide (GPH):cation symporter [Tessaracoccus antarcticus]|uniref:glycoside-pentoside-hexuronide (GPH):cation symporter n=1 Tax=Tessaracoccus antarcticus TaxID=2479848 RepID=UPI001F1AE9E3|nr:glycoside-pentoside-hexuronide (GPH):cation symporter [Tessaracoccus antarcticus]